MKTRHYIAAIALTCSTLVFSACTDEEENILPQTQSDEEILYIGGDDGDDIGPED